MYCYVLKLLFLITQQDFQIKLRRPSIKKSLYKLTLWVCVIMALSELKQNLEDILFHPSCCLFLPCLGVIIYRLIIIDQSLPIWMPIVCNIRTLWACVIMAFCKLQLSRTWRTSYFILHVGSSCLALV